MTISHAAFIKTLRAHIPYSVTVIAAISGGADSMVLLDLLAQTRTQHRLTVIVATLDHGLRPDAAADVALVQAAAAAYGLTCVAGQVDVPVLQQQSGDGVEAAARRARYDFLARVARDHSAAYIMTAHHADDQVETLLLHLLRGTGTQGLIGMTTVAPLPTAPDLTLLRPLLDVHRADIHAYCAQNALNYRDDPSNEDTRLQRNALRHQILPRLRQFNPQFDRAILRLADVMRIEQDFVAQQLQSITAEHVQYSPNTVIIDRAAFLSWHVAIQQRVMLDAARYLNVDATYQHVHHACSVARDGAVGAIAQFPDGVRLRADYKQYVMEGEDADLTYGYPQLEAEMPLSVPDTIQLGKYLLTTSWQPFATAGAQLALSPDVTLRLRNRRPGDRWQPLGMNGKHRKLKDWLIDHKIPQFIRDGLPILTANDRIVALLIPGQIPIAEAVAVQAHSSSVLYLALQPVIAETPAE